MGMPKELWAFMRARKKYWLWPIFLMMALLGVLLVLAQGQRRQLDLECLEAERASVVKNVGKLAMVNAPDGTQV